MKQLTKCYCGHTSYCDCGPEQYFKDIEFPQQERPETLEEASERYNSQFTAQNEFAIEDFINGAKWQQERMYSEEDMLLAFDMGTVNQLNFTNKKPYQDANEWFEQFKNK